MKLLFSASNDKRSPSMLVFQVVPRLLFFMKKKHPRHRHKPPEVSKPYRAVRTHSRQKNLGGEKQSLVGIYLSIKRKCTWHAKKTWSKGENVVQENHKYVYVYIIYIYMYIYIYAIYTYKYIYISHFSRFLKNYRLPLSWTYLNTENVTIVSVPEIAIKFSADSDRGRYLPVRQKGRFLLCFAYNWRS